MTLGPIIAASLAPLTTRPWALYVNSLDVLKEPVAAPRYAVPIETMKLRKVFWDSVGSLTFAIDNPARALTPTIISPGMEVRLTEYRSGTTYSWFLGYITKTKWIPDFGQQGNRIEVTCASIDVLLDWLVLARDLTFDGTTTTFLATVQTCLANCVGGTPELRAMGVGGGAPYASDADLPMGSPPGGTIIGNVTYTAGMSMRAVIQKAVGPFYAGARAAIDEYRGVRTNVVIKNGAPPLNDPWPMVASAYGETPGTITIPGAALRQRPENTSKEYDGTAGVRAVAVTHPSLNTETLGDGSGLVGPAAVVASQAWPGEGQSDVASEAAMYLFLNGFPIRGELVLDEIRAAGWGLRPASFTVSPMSLTLDALDHATDQLDMTSVEVRWFGDDYGFTIAYGVTPEPSGFQKIRALTRNLN
jgi:hypothetical protein